MFKKIPHFYPPRPDLPIEIKLPPQGFSLIPCEWDDAPVLGAWEYVHAPPPYSEGRPPYYAVVPYDENVDQHTISRRVRVPKEFCKCGKKRSGYRYRAKRYWWVCVDCDKPTLKWFRDFIYWDLSINLYAIHRYSGVIPRRY